MSFALGVLMMSGCQQVNDMVNKTANNNTTANSNANANANPNPNTNTLASPTNSAANANTSASNTAANTATAPKEEVPQTAEVKAFKNNLVGKWEFNNGTQIAVFTEDKIEIKEKSTGDLLEAFEMSILDEKTVEHKDVKTGERNKSTFTFKDDGKTLVWTRSDGLALTFKRVNPK